MQSRMFSPKTYAIETETKPSTCSQCAELAKITITIAKPYFTIDQFKGKFAKGPVDGVLVSIFKDYENENLDKTALVVTLTLGHDFNASDKTFRESINTISDLSLRDKDRLLAEYDNILKSHGLKSLYSKINHNQTNENDNFRGYAH